MDQPTRANYALLAVQEHLDDSADGPNVSWAEFVGNHRSSEFEFTVPRGPVTDPYLELQVFDVRRTTTRSSSTATHSRASISR